MSAHSLLFPPSSAYRWSECTGAPVFLAGLPPQPESEESREGTAAHWVFAENFEGRDVPVGTLAPNGVAVTEEMREGAALFVEVVRADTVTMLPGDQLHVESRVHCGDVHDECFGTPDLWTWRPALLRVYDYKFGHRYVEVIGNKQLTAYTAGVAKLLGASHGIVDQHADVEFVIIQPRHYAAPPVRRWRAPLSVLRGDINYLASKAAVALTENARLTPTPDGCRDCPGRHVCPALQAAGYTYADLARQATPADLTPDALGLELRMVRRAIALLEARESGLSPVAEDILRTGGNVPGFHMKETPARERWNTDAAQVVALGDALGVDLRKPVDVVTPAQARKKGLDEAVSAAYVERPSGKMALTETNEKLATYIFRGNAP